MNQLCIIIVILILIFILLWCQTKSTMKNNLCSKYKIAFHGADLDIIKDISDPRLLSFLGTNAVRSIGDRIASAMYVDTFKDESNTSVWLRLQKAPLYVPKTNDTFGAMQVLL